MMGPDQEESELPPQDAPGQPPAEKSVAEDAMMVYGQDASAPTAGSGVIPKACGLSK